LAAINLEQARIALKQTEEQKQQLQSTNPLNVPIRNYGAGISPKYQQGIINYNTQLEQSKADRKSVV
jgi:hypothetical protein